MLAGLFTTPQKNGRPDPRDHAPCDGTVEAVKRMHFAAKLYIKRLSNSFPQTSQVFISHAPFLNDSAAQHTLVTHPEKQWIDGRILPPASCNYYVHNSLQWRLRFRPTNIIICVTPFNVISPARDSQTETLAVRRPQLHPPRNPDRGTRRLHRFSPRP